MKAKNGVKKVPHRQNEMNDSWNGVSVDYKLQPPVGSEHDFVFINKRADWTLAVHF